MKKRICLILVGINTATTSASSASFFNKQENDCVTFSDLGQILDAFEEQLTEKLLGNDKINSNTYEEKNIEGLDEVLDNELDHHITNVAPEEDGYSYNNHSELLPGEESNKFTHHNSSTTIGTGRSLFRHRRKSSTESTNSEPSPGSILSRISPDSSPSNTLETRINDIEKKIQCIDGAASGKDDLFFRGCNVHVENGDCSTSANGKGNLIVGYNEIPTPAPKRTGSHNIVVGEKHEYTSFGGLVAGEFNEIKAPYATVTGGTGNKATANHASVSGGKWNTAGNNDASVSGGRSNTAQGVTSSISGGSNNMAIAPDSSILGGDENTAQKVGGVGRGMCASILGGNKISTADKFQIAPLFESMTGLVDGVVWQDANSDDKYGNNEPGFSGVQVVITDTNNEKYTVTSDSYGHYKQQVPAGTTTVDVLDGTVSSDYELSFGKDPTVLIVPEGGTASVLHGFTLQNTLPPSGRKVFELTEDALAHVDRAYGKFLEDRLRFPKEEAHRKLSGTKSTVVAYAGPVSLDREKGKNDMYLRHFDYFLEHGVDCRFHDTVIVLSQETRDAYRDQLANKNHRCKLAGHKIIVLTRQDRCYDMEAMRVILEEVDLSGYDEFVYLNCGVVGPKLPADHDSTVSWTAQYTRLLNDEVKMSGLSMNCLSHPHIQSMVFAVDQKGLQIIKNSGAVYDCGQHGVTEFSVDLQFKIIKRYEIGMSRAIMDAGYSLAATISTRGELQINPRDRVLDTMTWCYDVWHPQALHKLGGGVAPKWEELVFFKASRLIPFEIYDELKYADPHLEPTEDFYYFEMGNNTRDLSKGLDILLESSEDTED